MVPIVAFAKSAAQINNWQKDLQQVVTNYDELVSLLHLPPLENATVRAAMQQFPLRVPRPYLARIKPGDWNDPLLRQVLPLGIECVAAPGYQLQPLCEHDYNPVPGLIHKYQSRVLLTVTSACAINCRYCFRRHFDYDANRVNQAEWQQAIDYIAADPSISEVILSGGDPLIAPDKVLASLVARLEEVPHLRYLRIHTRMPVVIPQRIDAELLAWLAATRLRASVVLHCNHPNEIDDSVAKGLLQLQQIGVMLLNQTVLLRQINDSRATLEALSYRLYDVGVLPYYLHLLDKVQGAAHFEISDATAIQLHRELLASLPGYLVPKLVRELPGMAHKVPMV